MNNRSWVKCRGNEKDLVTCSICCQLQQMCWEGCFRVSENKCTRSLALIFFPLPSPVLMLRRLVYGVTQLSGKPKGQAKQALRCGLRCTFQEREQVGIDLVRIGCGHAGWKALVDFQSAIPQLRRQRSSIGTLDSISMRLIEPLAEAQTTITMAATGRLPWFNLSRYES